MKSFSMTEDSGKRNDWKTVKTLLRYLWPQGRFDLKIRVIFALLCMALAKIVNVYVPFLYKDAVDGLSGSNDLVFISFY